MKGDFSRDTFDPFKHFSRVLLQQGRVQLDADWNEQVAILLHYLRALAADLIGPHGGPGRGCGFKIASAGETDFTIGYGHYYVDGILCENPPLLDEPSSVGLPYTQQSGYPSADMPELEKGKTYLVYLDVWERHVTWVEDDGIREKALGGPDTATRAQVVWQVKVADVRPDGGSLTKGELMSAAEIKDWRDTEWVRRNIWQPSNRGRLRARAKAAGGEGGDPCITAPEARYRGTENRLYRVEIHQGGEAGTATFKWSRDNGTVVFPLRSLSGAVATLDHLGRDGRLALNVGDWVEVCGDDLGWQEVAGPLVQVASINPLDMTVTLKVPDHLSLPVDVENSSTHPLLRRWDQHAAQGRELEAGAVPITEQGDLWTELEDGLFIQFAPAEEGSHRYRGGDYWLIPARVATGNVEWPQEDDREANDDASPRAMPPHGVEHRYAPLAVFNTAQGVVDCRFTFSLSLK